MAVAKKSHGKVNPVTMGNPSKGASGGAAGRAAKKARRPGHKSGNSQKLNHFARDFLAYGARTFGDAFEGTKMHAHQKGMTFGTFSLGEHAVSTGDGRAIIRIVDMPKYRGALDSEIRLEVVDSDCDLPTGIFITAWAVEKFPKGYFRPNPKLDNNAQEQQRQLHDFLSEVYEQEIPKTKVASNVLHFPVQVAPQRPFNVYAGFAREEKTCSDIKILISGREQVYRIAGENGKYAVLALSSIGDIGFKEVTIRLKYLECGHELDGQVSEGVFVKLHNLKKESLGQPFGEHAQSMLEAGRLHAWIRKIAMAAGVKANTKK